MPTSVADLDTVQLGDVVRFPDGRSLTTRARAQLPGPAGSMSGFVVCGELAAMLAVPATAEDPVLLYVPVRTAPETIKSARQMYAGACRYWAPHLPGLATAMGELGWRIAMVAGSVDPVVVTFRSDEPTVWMKASLLRREDLAFLPLARVDESRQPTVERSTGWVVPGPNRTPSSAPATEQPVAVPAAHR